MWPVWPMTMLCFLTAPASGCHNNFNILWGFLSCWGDSIAESPDDDYSPGSVSCTVRPHQGHKHRQRTDKYKHTLLLLLLLLLTVKHSRPKTSKNAVFSGIFVPLEDTTLVFTMFMQHHGQNPSKQTAYSVSEWMRRTQCFLQCFFDKELKMSRKYRCFLHLYDFQVSRQTSQKHEYVQCFDKTTCKNKRCFVTIFRILQLVLRNVKSKHFLLHFCHCSSALKNC